MKHRKLIEAAEKAIEDLFSDTSVSAETTAEDLQGLADDIEMKVASIVAGLKASRA